MFGSALGQGSISDRHVVVIGDLGRIDLDTGRFGQFRVGRFSRFRT